MSNKTFKILKEFMQETLTVNLSHKVKEKFQKALEGKLGLFIRKESDKISMILYDAGMLLTFL